MPLTFRIDWTARLSVQAGWLLRLRWYAAAGQLATVVSVAWGLGIELRLAGLLMVIGLTAATNLALQLWLWRNAESSAFYRLGHWLLAAVMGFDLLALTALLALTGGPANPFVVFYFVNLALAAVILPAAGAWTLCAAGAGCIVLLFAWHLPLEALESGPQSAALRNRGLLVALATSALVVTYFITRVTRELQRREAELRVAEQKRFQSDRLQSLATLAAGAGHELASPLSTIAVIANELSLHLEGADVPPTVLEDVALIRTELDHCRSILDRMSGEAGQAAGEGVSPVSVQELVEEVLIGLRHPERVETDLGGASSQQLLVPLQALSQAVRGVVQNGLDASPDGQPVTLVARDRGDHVLLKVIDRGNGMDAAVLQRAGEPFFTTKEPGKGMGLGLFLTRSILDRLGGDLDLESRPGQGATARIRLPVERPGAAGFSG